MRVDIRDARALLSVSPVAISAYARGEGWTRLEPYGDHSDVYAADGLPEIIIPRTQRLGDYARVVATLIEIFANASERDELSIYRDLLTADRDVIRVRASESADGSLSVNQGVALISGARDMLLAAARSLYRYQPVYRADANKKANELVDGVRMGQTEQGSFVVTLLTDVVPPPMTPPAPDSNDYDVPDSRRMTKRLTEALYATRKTVESEVSGGGYLLADAVERGVSANLCEALDKMIHPFPTLDVGVFWAKTRPMKSNREVVRFAKADAPLLREAAAALRNREPYPDVQLRGMIERLDRSPSNADGSVTLRTTIEGRSVSVTALLKRTDYDIAIQAHQDKAMVVMKGRDNQDLERVGQRWRLLNPSVLHAIHQEGA